MASNFFHMQHMTACDTGLNYQITQQFIADTSCDLIDEKLGFAIQKTISTAELISKVKANLGVNARAVSMLETRRDRHEIVITGGGFSGDPVLSFVTIEEHPEIWEVTVDIISSPTSAKGLYGLISSEFENQKMGKIKWWFQGSRGVDAKEVYLPPLKTTIRPEFYPDMEDPQSYIADYMASDAAVLLMAGPPGTGKTTLLRHLIADYRLSAHVIYDEILMQKDSIFQDFLFDHEGDIMIIEDADTILNSREAEGNKLMSRFLNISDGLIKLPNKKLVFTTNIVDFGKVDHALIRPGRCFGVLETRPLNLTEAQTAAKVAKLPIPTEKREYTVAELFNHGHRAQVRRIGFGARHG